MPQLMQNGLANVFRQKLNGSLLQEADWKIKNISGATKILNQDRRRPIHGRDISLITTRIGISLTGLHLQNLSSRTTMDYMIWQAMYGSGAAIGTTSHTIKTLLQILP